ncbi:hypothetical protein BDV18DRAFT_159071 [Aspergillus unguis]
MSNPGIQATELINDPGPGFLGHLTPSTAIRHYEYRGTKQYLQDFQTEVTRYHSDTTSTASEWFLLTNIDISTLKKHFSEPTDDCSPFTRWSSYDAALNLLLVRQWNAAFHEVASRTFGLILDEATKIRPRHDLVRIGSTTNYAGMGNKSPDGVVLEVADEETRMKLLSDVRYWMRASGGDVKVVFTLCVGRQRPGITIGKWASGGDGLAHLEQRVAISLEDGGGINVVGAPLVIRHQQLFLIEPSDSEESAFEIDQGLLKHLADHVWSVQGFINS